MYFASIILLRLKMSFSYFIAQNNYIYSDTNNEIVNIKYSGKRTVFKKVAKSTTIFCIILRHFLIYLLTLFLILSFNNNFYKNILKSIINLRRLSLSRYGDTSVSVRYFIFAQFAFKSNITESIELGN